MSNSPRAGLVTGLLICLLSTLAIPSFATSPEEFLNRMNVKLRRTSSIYLRASSARIDNSGQRADTMNVTLAYEYPDRLLQWVRGEDQREQRLIYNGDTVVVSYPHIDVKRAQTVDERDIRRILVEEVPFAALFVGLASDRVKADSLTVRDSGPTTIARMQTEKENTINVIEGWFRTSDLRPERFMIRNRRGRHVVTILEYTEGERFPPAVEKALVERRPELLEESES